MLDELKAFFGITGGEMLAITKRISEVKARKIPDHIIAAERQYRKLKYDMQYSNSTPLQQELDGQELARLGELVRQKEEVEEMQTRELKDLQQEKTIIESKILHFRNRKKMLEDKEKPHIEEQISSLEKDIKWLVYKAERDKNFILQKVNTIQDRINELTYRKDIVLKKDNPERLDLLVQINELEIKKQAILNNEYKSTMEEIEKESEKIPQLQRQVNSIRTGFVDAINDCNENLIRLTGKVG